MENKTKRPFQVLPKDVRPTNYALTLQPDLELFNFRGNVDIDVQVTSTCIFIYIYLFIGRLRGYFTP